MSDSSRNTGQRTQPGGRWQVQLLGALQLRNGDIVIRHMGERAVALLFARLALEPRVAHSRLDLARAIWPEQSDDEARQRANLRKRLSTLRGMLEPPGFAPAVALELRGDTVRLNAGAFDIDTERFERHVRRGHWQAARDLYRGELLPGTHDEVVERRRQALAAMLEDADRELGRPPAEVPPEDDDAADADDEPPEAEPRIIVPYDTSFFGREQEVRALSQRVATHRVVVVHGAPGCGKSRLVVRTGEYGFADFENVLRVSAEYCDGVDDVVEQLRRAAGVDHGQKDPIEYIAAKLRSRKVLVLLDDFEHLAGAAGDAVIDTLLAALPLAHLLVTTRRALQRSDALVLPLAPLPLPDEGAGLEAAARNPAVALFVDRACAARGDFRLGARNVAAVIAICRYLDGIPLAIELAAAKMRRKHLLADMQDELRRSMRLLATRARGAERHSSIDAALDWSWRLLSARERTVLGALSVFRAGWTLGQAQAVAGGEGVAAALDELAKDALIVAQPADSGPPRLRLLAAVLEFAAARLSGPEAAALRRRQRDVFARLALDLERRHEWPPAADVPNLGAAMASALADDEPATAAAVALALAGHWRARGASEAERRLIERAAQAAAVPERDRSLLYSLLATLLVHAGRGKDAHTQIVHALRLAGDATLARIEAVLAQAGVFGLSAQDYGRTLELLLEAESLLPRDAPADLRGRFLLMRGMAALQVDGNFEGAKRMAERAENIFGGEGDRHAALRAMPLRTAALLVEGKPALALKLAQGGEQSAAGLGDFTVLLQMLNRQALALEALERSADALAVLQRQTQIAISRGAAYHIAYGIWNQCQPLVDERCHEDAALLAGFGEQHWLRQDGGMTEADVEYLARVQDAVERAKGAAAWRRWFARGKAMSEREGLARACGRWPAAD